MINILPVRRPTKTFSNREDAMDDTITTIYYLCDEFLKAIRLRDAPQVHLSTAEVMSVPLVAAAFFGGNLDKTRLFLEEYGYMPNMISKGHLNRRIHAIEPGLWRGLFALLAESFKHDDDDDDDDDPKRTYYYYYYYYYARSTPCPYRYATTTSASGAAGFIRPRSTEGRSAGTSPASGATFTACGCIWWSPKRASQWSSP